MPLHRLIVRAFAPLLAAASAISLAQEANVPADQPAAASPPEATLPESQAPSRKPGDEMLQYRVKIPQPLYPYEALSESAEGHVVIEFGISERGRVVDPVVIEPGPRRDFGEVTLRTLKAWRFRPAGEWATPPGQRRFKMGFIFDIYPCMDSSAMSQKLGFGLMHICAATNPQDEAAMQQENSRRAAGKSGDGG